MDTTISGSIFLNFLQVLLVLPTPVLSIGHPHYKVAFPPASASPAFPGPCSWGRLGAGCALLSPSPAPSFRPLAALGSSRPARSAFGCFRSHSATSGGIAPARACRCRTSRRLRSRASGAPQTGQGRRAASGETAWERREARRRAQVRRAGTLAAGLPTGLGAPHSGASSDARAAPDLGSPLARARGWAPQGGATPFAAAAAPTRALRCAPGCFLLLFRNALVLVPPPTLDGGVGVALRLGPL